MTERVINMVVSSKPDEACYVLPEGWYYKKTLYTLPGGAFVGPTVMAILITDEREDRMYNPDNVVYGPAHGHIEDVEEPTNVSHLGGYFAYEPQDGSIGKLRATCGRPDSSGLLCSYAPHKTGPHSWEPYDTEDAKIERGEYHPHYYQTESGMDPWDVIKAFNLDYWGGTMVAYLCRAGRKPGESELSDLRKVLTFAGERIRQLEADQSQNHICVQGLCNEHA